MKKIGSLITIKLIAFGILLTGANGLFDDGSGRRTAVGDFDKINEIFENAYLVLPGEFPISDRFGFLTLNMLVRNVKCFDIYVGDVAISHQRPNDQNTEVLLEISHVSLRCEMDYQYTYGFFRGDGLSIVNHQYPLPTRDALRMLKLQIWTFKGISCQKLSCL
jgi:hypothetical protein